MGFASSGIRSRRFGFVKKAAGRRSAWAALILGMSSWLAAMAAKESSESPEALDELIRPPLSELQSGAKPRKNPGVKEAGQPIPQTPGALTALKVQGIFDAWAQEKMLDAYEKIGRKDARWDTLVREAIRDSVRTWIAAPDAPETADLDKKLQALRESGCDDPLAQFLCAPVRTAPQRAESVKVLPLIISQLESSGYSRAVLYLAQVNLWKITNRYSSKAAEAETQAAAALESLKKALSERALTAEDAVVWNEFICQGDFEKFFEKNSAAVTSLVEAVPGFPDWLKHRLRGRAAVARAWVARGPGFASSVTPEGWKGWEKELAVARQELTKAWELNPQHPSAATQMIAVSMGSSAQPLPDMRLWFDRATEARFDNPGAYANLILGIRPRWHGCHEALLAFGRACAATGRYDTEVPAQFLTVARHIGFEWEQPEVFYAKAAPYAELRDVCVGYIKQARTDRERDYYLSQGAVFAAKCGQPAEAREFLRRLNYQLHPRAAAEWALEADPWVRENAAATGPLAKAVQSADRAFAAGRFSESAQILTAAQKTPNLVSAETAYLEARLSLLNEYLRLEAAEWQPFRLPETGQEFRNENWNWYGKFRRPAPESIRAEGYTTQRSYLYHRRWASPVVELRGEIEFVTHDTGHSEAVFSFGPDIKGGGYTDLRLNKGGPDGDGIWIGKGKDKLRYFQRRPFGQRLQFVVRVAQGEMRLEIDGEKTVTLVLPDFEPSAPDAERHLAIGTSAKDPAHTVVFHNLEIRIPTPAKSAAN